ncbi:L,D-transpeptidase, partial [Thauera linaloolentis]
MHIRVDIGRQCLGLFGDDGACIRRYPVSTALNGAGEEAGSQRTPRGRHRIRARIGAGAPAGAVFRGR